MQRLLILGSTGSIGTQTLNVVRRSGRLYEVVGLCASSDTDKLLKQVKEFSPKFVGVVNEKRAADIKLFLPAGTRLMSGEKCLSELSALEEVDTVVVASSGIASIDAIITALIKNKKIALANKEALVTAGQIITKIARATGGVILPVDSEHGAIFQCLNGAGATAGAAGAGQGNGGAAGGASMGAGRGGGRDNGTGSGNNADGADVIGGVAYNAANIVHKLILTASGGPFLKTAPERLKTVRAADALVHPTYKMGKKISVDSSTMFNKGLEVIEAKWLFGVDIDKIEVLIHPQSIVHSLVEFCDRSVLAQLGLPSMELPIAYALSFPKRIPVAVNGAGDTVASGVKPLSLVGKNLEFFAPDDKKFPLLNLCREASARGGLYPTVLNAANDIAVERFLNDEISYTNIYKIVQKAFLNFTVSDTLTVENIIRLDAEVKKYAKKLVLNA
jgi:1-deoxy-D-xylulose-5-phosphate reductoisomerase